MKTILVKRSKGEQAQTDYYKKLAAQKFNIPYEQVTDDMRAAVKVNEIARSYGMQHPSEYLLTDLRRFFVVELKDAKTERQVGMSAALGMNYGIKK